MKLIPTERNFSGYAAENDDKQGVQRMKRHAFKELKATLIALIVFSVFSTQTSLARQAAGEEDVQIQGDKKIDDWLSYIQGVIISNDLAALNQANEIADKAVKRADKKWGVNNVNTGYVLAHQSLAQVNYLSSYNQISPAEAMALIVVAYQFRDQYRESLDAPSQSILTVLAKLSEARALKRAREMARARALYDEAIAELTKIKGGHDYIWMVESERMFAEEF